MDVTNFTVGQTFTSVSKLDPSDKELARKILEEIIVFGFSPILQALTGGAPEPKNHTLTVTAIDQASGSITLK